MDHVTQMYKNIPNLEEKVTTNFPKLKYVLWFPTNDWYDSFDNIHVSDAL